MDQFPRRLPDGGEDSGGQDERGDRRGMEGRDSQRHPQDYMVVPGQPWLDGFCVEKGLIRQFVAMPLGEGYTPEEQLTGEAEHGGLQIAVYPMKRSKIRGNASDVTRMCTSRRCTKCAYVTHSRDGVGTGWSHASGDIRGRTRNRCMGHVDLFAVFRAYRQ